MLWGKSHMVDAPGYSSDFVDYEMDWFHENNSLDYGLAEDSGEKLLPEYLAGRLVWNYVSPLIIIIGTVGSILSLLVLCQRSMRSKTTMFYLASLAVADLMCLYTGLARLWLEHTQDVYIRLYSDTSCKLHTFVVYLSLDFSAWILVAVSLDRCVQIISPRRAKTWCTIRYARISLASLACVVTLVNCHFFWTYQLEGDSSAGHIYSNGGEKCYADSSSAMTVRFIESVWPWIDLCFYCLFPFVVMLSCDVIITKQLVQSERAMASHKRRLFHRRKLTSKLHSPPTSSLRPSGVTVETGNSSRYRYSDSWQDQALCSVSSANDEPLERRKLFHQCSLDSKSGAMTSSIKLSESHFDTVYFIASRPSCENVVILNDCTRQVEIPTNPEPNPDPNSLLVTHNANVINAQHTHKRHTGPSLSTLQLLQPTHLNLATRNGSIFARRRGSLDSLTHLDCQKRLARREVGENVRAVNLMSDQNCKVISPSNVSTRFTFIADDILLTSDTVRKRNSARVKGRQFSCKVHPVTSDNNDVLRNCVRGENSNIKSAELRFDNSLGTKSYFHETENISKEESICAMGKRPDSPAYKAESTYVPYDEEKEIKTASRNEVNQAYRGNKQGPVYKNAFKNSSINSERRPSRSTSSVSKILLAVSFTFWVLNAPIVIFIIGYTYWAETIDHHRHASLYLAWAVVNCLQYVNNAIHFFLYCMTAPKFRQELMKLATSKKSKP